MFKIIFAGFFLIASNLSFSALSEKVEVEHYQQRIEKIFNELRADNLNILDQFYDKQISFQDPLGEIVGLDKLKKYYGKTYENVKSISFVFHEFIVQVKSVVATWTMSYSTDKLNGGEPIKVEGNSLIKFGGSSNLAIYHRDYFDVGSMVYEHVPFVGFFVRKIKHKLEKD